jgi:hypothetical protein
MLLSGKESEDYRFFFEAFFFATFLVAFFAVFFFAAFFFAAIRMYVVLVISDDRPQFVIERVIITRTLIIACINNTCNNFFIKSVDNFFIFKIIFRKIFFIFIF